MSLITGILMAFMLAQTVNVTGDINATGTVKAAGYVFPDGSSLTSVDWAKVRVLTYLAGCDVCGVLSAFSDQKMIYQNLYGVPMKVNEVRCYSDADTATVNLRRDDGTPEYILQSAAVCTPSGAIITEFIPGEDILLPENKIDFDLVGTNGLTHGVTVAIKLIIQY